MSGQNFGSKDLDLLESGLFADATITCGDRTWKVHKSIICRCEWFKKAFAGNFEVMSRKDYCAGRVSLQKGKKLVN